MDPQFKGVLIFVLYLLPAIIAEARNHRQRLAIRLTSILFGWTVVVWVIMFAWALTNDIEKEPGK